MGEEYEDEELEDNEHEDEEMNPVFMASAISVATSLMV